jgi:hypothetical protein
MPKILLLPLATAGFVLLEEAESWGWVEVPFAEVVQTRSGQTNIKVNPRFLGQKLEFPGRNPCLACSSSCRVGAKRR